MKFKIYAAVFSVAALVFGLSDQIQAQLKPQTLQQIRLLIQEKESRSPVQQKIDSRLLQAVKENRGEKMAPGINLEQAGVNKDRDGNLNVDINAAVTDALIRKIETLGGKILYPSAEYHSIRAQVNLLMIEKIAAYKEVKFIEPAAFLTVVGSGVPKNKTGKNGIKGSVVHPPFAGISGKPLVNSTFEKRAERVRTQIKDYLMHLGGVRNETFSGPVNSEGDRAHRADDARNTYGYEGQGIRIGVISDTYNALGAAGDDIANGELPGPGNPLGNTTPITVVADYPTGTDEGRAMLQIVHDIAPKAQLFFATAYSSPANFADNIKALRSAPNNCDIIIDDVSYNNEPVFQDGLVAQAVNTVTASGAMYFSSAGNSGSLAKNTSGVWEGDFNGTGSDTTLTGFTKTGKLHNFGTAANPVYSDSISLAGGFYNLNWADPLGGSSNDYDLFVIRAAGTVKASSTNIQTGTQNPYEQLPSFTFAAGDRLVVFKAASAAVRAFSLNTNRGRLKTGTSGQTGKHASAADAYCVAAADATQAYPSAFSSPNTVETFSSDGPRRIFFNADTTPVTPGNFLFGSNGGTVRAKPDITAADGVSTTLSPSSGLNPFYGTSAAAPHAGAIAALLKSANPALTPAQIRTFLTTTALDIESPGYDNVSGFGIIQAFQAMQAVNPAPLSNIALGTVTATEGSFKNDNGIVDPGELANLVVQLTNPSLAEATAVNATLTTTTPGITIVGGSAAYGSIASSANASNTLAPFVFAVSSSVQCGSVINFVLTVTFGGGLSPKAFQFSKTVGSQPFMGITSTLGATPPSGTGYTAVSGQQTGRLVRGSAPSTCEVPVANPGLQSSTGSRQYDAYTFTNSTSADQCVTVEMVSTNGLNIYTAAYDDSGFVPSNPRSHYIAEPGQSAQTQTYSFNVPAGKAFTVVVHDVNVTPASNSPYTLSISLANCSAGPACTPVNITTASIPAGASGTPYTQSISASGGSSSGAYNFILQGNLPAGLSFSGNTLTGTPTQAGSFPITLIANDPAGCPGDTMSYTLVIKGITPASITATGGTPQSTYPTTQFPAALEATVKDSSGSPLAGVNVIFAAPATGASGTFSGGLSADTVVTNSSGIAVASTFTANTVTGNYKVTASVAGLSADTFRLSNFCPSNFVVTSSADDGAGSLREIINNACPGITVTFDQSVTLITLTSGELKVNKAITINGPGAGKLTISGNNTSRIFQITANSSTVSISGMTIRDGNPADTNFNGGGGILVYSGTVNVSNCVLTNNTASLSYYREGGAIDNEGTGIVSIDRCTIVNNTAVDDGGGVANWGSSMRITNSTIAGNTAGTTGTGGGIHSYVPLTVTNCTIFGNLARSGGGIYREGSTITFKNTIIAGDTLVGTGGTGPDIFGASGLSSANYNLIQSTSGGTISGTTTNNITGVSPNLFPLGNYGGATPVLLPRPNSVVINTGDAALTTGTDQRGFARLTGSKADIGSVEANYTFASTDGTPQSTITGTTFPVNLQAKVMETDNNIGGVTVTFTAPVAGASGTFPGPSATATATTNISGIATAPAFTANDTLGTYIVKGSIGTAFMSLDYTLTNTERLPITFGTISATASNCNALLRWETLSEVNSKDFSVEFSTDAIHYISVGSVVAKGNSVTKQVYSYSYTSTEAGNNYYRIKETDKDGAVTYSQVVIVLNNCDKLPIVAYPNPVRDNLTVMLPGTARQTMTIYDASGRKITEYAANGGRATINTKAWAKGMYTLSITQKGKTAYLLKVIKD